MEFDVKYVEHNEEKNLKSKGKSGKDKEKSLKEKHTNLVKADNLKKSISKNTALKSKRGLKNIEPETNIISPINQASSSVVASWLGF